VITLSLTQTLSRILRQAQDEGERERVPFSRSREKVAARSAAG
jgi:hypothetical protein